MDVSRLYNSDIQFKHVEDVVRIGGKAGNGEATNEDAMDYEDRITSLDSKYTSDFLQKTIDRANKHLTNSTHEFSYSVHEKTGEFVIKIIDSETKEIVREVPPEKTLDAVAKMWELAGILLDEKK